MIALGFVTNIFQRGAASMGRLNYILDSEPQIDDRAATVPAGKNVDGEIEFRNLTFTYPTVPRAGGQRQRQRANGAAPPRTARAAGYHPARSGRLDPRDRRADRQRKNHAGRARSRASGKPRMAPLLIDGRSIREWPLETLRRADRLRAAGHVSVQRNAPRKHRLRCANCDTDDACTKPPTSPASPPTSTNSPRNSTPWSASAASRFPADRSSAPPSPAPSSAIRES